MSKEKLREIPSIDRLLHIIINDGSMQNFSRELIAAELRKLINNKRMKIIQGDKVDVSLDNIVQSVKNNLLGLSSASLHRVINATGVVMHTNLGRAPLSKTARSMVESVAKGYSNLEYDIKTGKRGSRYSHVAAKIRQLTGAEDVIVVNNNAAAVLLVLASFAKEREIIVSRGQLVEIGGSFRIPDVLSQSGTKLMEVGTTNKTYLADYENAITANTAAILKVHTSNYRVIGFTSQPESAELAALAHKYGLPLIDDLGSGTLVPVNTADWQEPTVGELIANGVDIITFSGDKLMGSGQAGIIVGKKQYIDIMKSHPLLRAIRIDKLSLAALEGTLIDYIAGNIYEDIPVQAMLNTTIEKLAQQANELLYMLEQLKAYGWQLSVIKLCSQAGGGALPEVNFISYGVSIVIAGKSAAWLEEQLRNYEQNIVVRIQDNKILLDVRCLSQADMTIIKEACFKLARGF